MSAKTSFSAEILQTAHEEALKKKRLLRWGEPINLGDEFMRLSGHFIYSINICSYISLFDKKLASSNPFQTDIHPDYAVKVIPVPQPDQRTLDDRLQLIEDNLRSLHAKLNHLHAEMRNCK